MADTNPTDRERNPADEDRKVQSAVLEFLVGENPDRFTISELSRAMNIGSADFGVEDAVERAVRELVGAGLLHCRGGFVLPTRAALYFERLQMD